MNPNGDRTHYFLMKGISRELWARVKNKAEIERISVKGAILAFLEQWAAEPPDPRKRYPPGESPIRLVRTSPPPLEAPPQTPHAPPDLF